MSERVKQKQDARRRELLEVALKLFAEVGYEKSSIRLIASKAGGDIGLIYHYFASKTEIYEAALAYYNDKYVEKVTRIFTDLSLTFEAKIASMFSAIDTSLAEYRPLIAEANQEMIIVLLTHSINSLSPIFDQLIKQYLSEQGIEMDDSERLLMSNYVLYGCSGVIHTLSDHSMQQRYDIAKRMISGTLEQIIKEQRK